MSDSDLDQQLSSQGFREPSIETLFAFTNPHNAYYEFVRLLSDKDPEGLSKIKATPHGSFRTLLQQFDHFWAPTHAEKEKKGKGVISIKSKPVKTVCSFLDKLVDLDSGITLEFFQKSNIKASALIDGYKRWREVGPRILPLTGIFYVVSELTELEKKVEMPFKAALGSGSQAQNTRGCSGCAAKMKEKNTMLSTLYQVTPLCGKCQYQVWRKLDFASRYISKKCKHYWVNQSKFDLREIESISRNFTKEEVDDLIKHIEGVMTCSCVAQVQAACRGQMCLLSSTIRTLTEQNFVNNEIAHPYVMYRENKFKQQSYFYLSIELGSSERPVPGTTKLCWRMQWKKEEAKWVQPTISQSANQKERTSFYNPIYETCSHWNQWMQFLIAEVNIPGLPIQAKKGSAPVSFAEEDC